MYQYQTKNKNVRSKKRHPFRLIALIVVLLLLLGGGTWWYVSHHKHAKYPGPTAADKQEVNQNKQRLSQQQSNNSNSSSTGQTKPGTGDTGSSGATKPPSASNPATVNITFAGPYGQDIQVSSYVSNVFENGGTCTLTLTQGSNKITKQDQGIENVSYTTCPTFTVSRSEFPTTGTWTATVSYQSNTASGTSASRNVEIQ